MRSEGGRGGGVGKIVCVCAVRCNDRFREAKAVKKKRDTT